MDERKRIPDVSYNPLAEKYARMISVQLHNANWTAAHSLINQYQSESQTFRPPLTPRQWLDEPICNVPGISLRLVNTIETHFDVIFVEQFLRMVPNESVLLEADNVGPIQTGQLREAFRAIGIAWPRPFRHENDIDATAPDQAADQLLHRARDSPDD